MTPDTIIVFCGIRDHPRHDAVWCVFIQKLQAAFPAARIVLKRERFGIRDAARTRRIIADAVAQNDNGESILLIGHSLGGLLALRAAELFVRSRVIAVATLFSPHLTLGGWLSRLHGTEKVSVPIISFEAVPDRMVPWGAAHPMSSVHRKLFTDHLWGLKWKGAEITHSIREFISRLGPD